MPCRNIVRHYDSNTYYHVYNRGVEKRKTFLDNEDYAVFLSLFKRYLSDEPKKNRKGREYRQLGKDVELVAFCLMPNHFHLLVFQIDKNAITQLMHSVCSTYTTYFNKKYNRVGPLFQGAFKASSINDESYLVHSSRYIHRNPKKYLEWEWSSLPYWLGYRHASWIKHQRLNEILPDQYLKFINDEQDYKKCNENASVTLDDI